MPITNQQLIEMIGVINEDYPIEGILSKAELLELISELLAYRSIHQERANEQAN